MWPWAGPASAHALLLRTDPAPQTTVKIPPRRVRLEFSEPVEVTFGAVRVFDVDGHRVDSGRLSRTAGGREVDVATPHLKDGTYSVTWRVISADGHPVHGGFSFYVGAPSAVSAVAVGSFKGAGRLIGWGFGAVRFVWFAALCGLVGLVVVRRFVWTPVLAAVPGSDAATVNERFRARHRRLLPACWAVLLIAGALSIVFQAANASGLSLGRSFSVTVLRGMFHTTYGHYWVWSMAITLALVAPVTGLSGRYRLVSLSPDNWITIGGAAVAGLCAVVALNGHARTLDHPALNVASVGIHLLAVTAWVGGLAALVALAGPVWRCLPPGERGTVLRHLVRRFGKLGLFSAATVLATGVINAFLDLAAVSDLWRTGYGRVVGAKAIALALALGLAARHHLSSPRRLAGAESAGRESALFAYTSATELVALICALALAAGLVALVPGRSLALAARGPVNLEHRVGADTLQFFLDPSALGDNQVHLTYVSPQGLSDQAIVSAQAVLGLVGQASAPLTLRLISPGHFVGDYAFGVAGLYDLRVAQTAGLPGTTFEFRIRGRGR